VMLRRCGGNRRSLDFIQGGHGTRLAFAAGQDHGFTFL
jgi:hypothetical protein